MRVTTVVIGAGHAGLAMSHCLTERSVDHVILERGEVAHSWKTERWDSLRLLTPNWQARLPGMTVPEHDPDGFMAMPEVVQLIDDYATTIDAPVRTRTTVSRVTAIDDGYEVATDGGVWRGTTVVLASGPANIANVPAKVTVAAVRVYPPATASPANAMRVRPSVAIVRESALGIRRVRTS